MTTRIPPEYPPWPPRPDIEEGGEQSTDLEVAGDGSVIPLIYSAPWEHKPLIYFAKYHNDILYLGLAWCWGGRNGAYQEWGNNYGGPVLYEGATQIANSANGIVDADKVAYWKTYKGDPALNEVNPQLAAIEPGYNDTLIYTYKGTQYGICHSVVGLKPEARINELNAQLHGTAVYDPRSGLFGPSYNPALALADFITDPFYGAGIPEVDEASVIDAANYCEEFVDGQWRWRARNAFVRSTAVSSIVETMRATANLMVECNGYTAKLIVLRPTSVSFSINETNMLQDSCSINQLGQDETPTVVSVTYTDTRYRPFEKHTIAVTHPDVDLGVRPYLESSYHQESMIVSGSRTTSQAIRFATERLNYFNLSTLRVRCIVFDEDKEYRLGQVIQVSHPYGLLNHEFRIVGLTLLELGRWELSLEQYDPAIYSDAIGEVPTKPDHGLPDPRIIPKPTIQSFWKYEIWNANQYYAGALATPPSYPYKIQYDWQHEVDTTGGTTYYIFDAKLTTGVRTNFDGFAMSPGHTTRVRVRVKASYMGNFYYGPWSDWSNMTI